MSGGDRRLLEVAKWWKRRGIKFKVLTSESGCEVCKQEGLKEFCWQTAPGWIDRLGLLPSYFLRILFAFLKIPRFGSDFIAYSSSDFLTDVVPAVGIKFLNRKSRWVALSHHIIKGRFISSFFQKISFFFIRNFADVVIVPSRTTKKELLSLGFNNRRVRVVPNGLDISFISKVSGSEKLQSDACFLARLSPSKGIYDLPRIWQLVASAVPNARLFVIGGGQMGEVRKLKELLATAGVEKNVRLLGFVSEEEKYRALKSSKVFISPSREEGFGIAVLEAMACGLPVVAWDLPVYREVFEQGMIRVPFGNCEEFAAAVVKLLTDKELRSRMGQEAKTFAQKYNWDRVIEEEWQTIMEMIS